MKAQLFLLKKYPTFLNSYSNLARMTIVKDKPILLDIGRNVRDIVSGSYKH